MPPVSRSLRLREVALLSWAGMALGGLFSPTGLLLWLGAMAIPLCAVGFLGSTRLWVALSVFSVLCGGVAGWRGTPSVLLAGPWTLFVLLTFLLVVNRLQHRLRCVTWQTRCRASERSLEAVSQEVGLRQERVRLGEEEIFKISELYGLSQSFLATLDLEEALGVCDEALLKWMPHLTCAQRSSYLATVRAQVEAGRVSVGGLIQTLPAGQTQTPLRERWAIVGGQLALGLKRISFYRQVQASAMHDGLTGLLTRHFFMRRLQEEMARALRRETVLTFLMVDLDHFKEVNDTQGHLFGDLVLREVAQRIRHSVREMDVVGRCGGEEFGVVVPDAGRALGLQIAERIRRGVEALAMAAPDETVRMTVSIGGSHFPTQAGATEPLLEQADQAMYQAKRAGRNRVMFHPQG